MYIQLTQHLLAPSQYPFTAHTTTDIQPFLSLCPRPRPPHRPPRRRNLFPTSLSRTESFIHRHAHTSRGRRDQLTGQIVKITYYDITIVHR